MSAVNSYLPQLMRRNTVGVRYIEGNRNEDHYEKIIEEILNINEDELCKKLNFVLALKIHEMKFRSPSQL